MSDLPPRIEITPLAENDTEEVTRLWGLRWGGETIIVHGSIYSAHELLGFWARRDGKPAGLVTYRLAQNECEVISLDSLLEGEGIGTALLAAVEQAARDNQSTRVYLSTTNDNLKALGWYQRRGYRLAALRAGAVDEARQSKPAIPLVGDSNIPIHDELELEKKYR